MRDLVNTLVFTHIQFEIIDILCCAVCLMCPYFEPCHDKPWGYTIITNFVKTLCFPQQNAKNETILSFAIVYSLSLLQYMQNPFEYIKYELLQYLGLFL